MTDTSLTLTHLRFDLVATSPIKLGREQAGERLRNALAGTMLRTVCTAERRELLPDPEHAARCPVCWLVAAEVEPGEVRRAYSIAPPLPPRDLVRPGDSFSFNLTLYGRGIDFLPYFVLVVPEMGRGGVGPGRGRFELEAIWASNPLTGEMTPVVQRGTRQVRLPEADLCWEQVLIEAKRRLATIENRTLRLRFLTPIRLVSDDALLKAPDFGVIFQRMLHRIDQLGQQFATDEPRPAEERQALQALADRVRLVESDVRWLDLWSWSGRTKRKSPMGGFVGSATYRAETWEPLLPWLILGQGTQVGKLTVKGNGLFEIALPQGEGYWRALARQVR